MQSRDPRHSPRQAKSGVEGLLGARGGRNACLTQQSDLPARRRLLALSYVTQKLSVDGKANSQGLLAALALAVFNAPEHVRGKIDVE